MEKSEDKEKYEIDDKKQYVEDINMKLQCRCNQNIQNILSNNHHIHCYLSAATNRLRHIPHTHKRRLLLHIMGEAARWFIKCEYGMFLFYKMLWENVEIETETDNGKGIENEKGKTKRLNMKKHEEAGPGSNMENKLNVKGSIKIENDTNASNIEKIASDIDNVSLRDIDDEKSNESLNDLEERVDSDHELVFNEAKMTTNSEHSHVLNDVLTGQKTLDAKGNRTLADSYSEPISPENLIIIQKEVQKNEDQNENGMENCLKVEEKKLSLLALAAINEKHDPNIDLERPLDIESPFKRRAMIDGCQREGLAIEEALNCDINFNGKKRNDISYGNHTVSEQQIGSETNIFHGNVGRKDCHEKNCVTEITTESEDHISYQKDRIDESQRKSPGVLGNIESEETEKESNHGFTVPYSDQTLKSTNPSELQSHIHSKAQPTTHNRKSKKIIRKSKYSGHFLSFLKKTKKILKETINHTLPYYLNLIQTELGDQISYYTQDVSYPRLKRIIYEPSYSISDNLLINEKIKLYRKIKLRHLEIINMVKSTPRTKQCLYQSGIETNTTILGSVLEENPSFDSSYDGPSKSFDILESKQHFSFPDSQSSLASQFGHHFYHMKNSYSPLSKLIYFYSFIDELIKDKQIDNIEEILPVVIYLIIKTQYIDILKDLELIKMDMEVRQHIELVECCNIADKKNKSDEHLIEQSCQHIGYTIRQSTTIQENKYESSNQSDKNNLQTDTTQIKNMQNTKRSNDQKKTKGHIYNKNKPKSIRSSLNINNQQKNNQEKDVDHNMVCSCYISLSYSQSTYLLVLLESAIFFIKTMEYDKLDIEKEEYDSLFLS